MTAFGRQILTLPRPGEQRKDACPAAHAHGGFKASRSQTILPVKADFPEPVLGQMEPTPAVVRRPFPEPRVGQMEFI